MEEPREEDRSEEIDKMAREDHSQSAPTEDEDPKGPSVADAFKGAS